MKISKVEIRKRGEKYGLILASQGQKTEIGFTSLRPTTTKNGPKVGLKSNYLFFRQDMKQSLTRALTSP